LEIYTQLSKIFPEVIMRFIFILSFSLASGSQHLTIPNVPTLCDEEICQTPRPIGIEVTKSKVGRLCLRLDKVEKALEAKDFNEPHIRHLFEKIYELTRSMPRVSFVLETRIANAEKLFNKKKAACCCVIL
jgi:hypothetical protein